MKKVDPEQRREEICRAAMRVFARRGVQKSTTDDICREAGISPGRLYFYFSSKDEIIKSVLCRFADYFESRVGEAFSSSSLVSGIRELSTEARTEMRGLDITPRLSLEIFALAQLSPELQAIVHRSNARIRQSFRENLEMGKKDGTLRPDTDVDILTSVCMILAGGQSVMEISDPDYDPARYIEAVETCLKPWIAPKTA